MSLSGYASGVNSEAKPRYFDISYKCLIVIIHALTNSLWKHGCWIYNDFAGVNPLHTQRRNISMTLMLV